MPSTDPIARARATLAMSRSVTKPLGRLQGAYRAEMEQALAGLIAHAESLTAVRQTADEQLQAADADSAVLRQVRELSGQACAALDTITAMLRGFAAAGPDPDCSACSGTGSVHAGSSEAAPCALCGP